MMWGYMTHVESYFPASYFEKYGSIFGSIWVATAYKGAQGELATVTRLHERVANHVSWARVMRDQYTRAVVRFEGVALTGWSRYDHFLTLCELLPQAVPSLVSGLQVLKIGGQLDEDAQTEIYKKLECAEVGTKFSL